MAKIKLRRQVDSNGKSQKSNGFNLDARQIGVAVAGVLVSEIANIAIQKISEKVLKNDDSNELDVDSSDDRVDERISNPIYAAAAQVGEKVGKAESSAGDVADAVRSSIGNLKLSLSDVIDVLRDAGQHLKEQSVSTFSTVSNSSGAVSEAVKENVSNRATAVRDRVVPEVKSEFKKARRNKKKKSKKSKNKN